jgi:hypothetical protein
VARLAAVDVRDAVNVCATDRARAAIGVRQRWLWSPMRVVSSPPSVKQRVDHGDDELVDVVASLLRHRR